MSLEQSFIVTIKLIAIHESQCQQGFQKYLINFMHTYGFVMH
jgi:hypothetical protein